jgi:hypothetical protein
MRMGLKKMGERCGLDSSGSRQRPLVSSCEHGNESFWVL